MRIVLDTTILVRATENSQGLARELLLYIVASKQQLLISNEMLYELARVLRYPRLRAFMDYPRTAYTALLAFSVKWLEIVLLSPIFTVPIRDVNDIIVVQTAVVGEANVLCTRDEDFHDPVITLFLDKAGITVMDDMLQRLRRDSSKMV